MHFLSDMFFFKRLDISNSFKHYEIQIEISFLKGQDIIHNLEQEKFNVDPRDYLFG